MNRDRLVLKKPREARREIVRQFVGRHYSEEGSDKKVYENLVALFVRIVGRSLVPKSPRVMLSTFNQQFKPVVAAEQDWVNQEIERIHFQKTLQRVVVDALFSVGILKVAIAKPADAALYSWNLPAGAPFATHVDLDDFICDTRARSFDEVSYIGHRFRVPLAAVKASKSYGPGRLELTESTEGLINKEGDEKVSAIGRTYYGDNLDVEPMVDLWEVYLPRHRIIVTLPESYLSGPTLGTDVEPLAVQRWIGPDEGPYHVLGFDVVPGNLMFKAPLQDVFDLHLAQNAAMRKAVAGVERLKEVGAVQQGAAEDAGRVIQANDGDLVQLNNPDKIKLIAMGGTVIQQALLMAQTLKQEFSFMAGNLDMMGGLSPQSKTLGQDQMLEANASKTVTDMQETTVAFTARALKALIWFHHHDPVRVMKTNYSVPGLPEMNETRHVFPNNPQLQGKLPQGAMVRNTDWEDMDVRVDPYSMQAQTPQSRLQAINQIVTTVVIPMMQILVQQGVSFDIVAYLRKVGQYLDLPDLQDILTIAEPPDMGQGDGPPEPGSTKAPETKRTYERVSRSGQTQQGTNQNLVQQLMGVNPGGSRENKAVPAAG